MAGSSDRSADEVGGSAGGLAESTDTPGRRSSGIAGVIPMVGWLPRYDRGWLRPDVIAGVSVAALVVPKSLGYAGIVGNLEETRVSGLV